MNLWRKGGTGETVQQTEYFLSLLELSSRTLIKSSGWHRLVIADLGRGSEVGGSLGPSGKIALSLSLSVWGEM